MFKWCLIFINSFLFCLLLNTKTINLPITVKSLSLVRQRILINELTGNNEIINSNQIAQQISARFSKNTSVIQTEHSAAVNKIDIKIPELIIKEGKILDLFTGNNWLSLNNPWSLIIGIIFLVLLVIFFEFRIVIQDRKLKKLNKHLSDQKKELEKTNKDLMAANKERINKVLKIQRMKAEKASEIEQIQLGLLSNISNEFRTPIMLIQGYIEKIQKFITLEKNTNIKKYIQNINENSIKLLKLIDQIINVQKTQANQLQLNISYGDLIQFIKNIYHIFYIIAEKSLITLKLISEKDSLYTWFDTEKMEEILYNLLSNAFKYAKENDTITIFVSDSDDEILIKIEDNDADIPEGDVEYIFDRYYQVNKKNGSSGNSSSGLTFIKKLVEMHFGTILFQNKPQSGTCFLVKLPIKMNFLNKYQQKEVEIEKAIQMEEITQDESDDYFEKKETVKQMTQNVTDILDKPILLVIDDSPSTIEFIREELEIDYYISWANNGEIGLEMALEILPDLIISEIIMPKLTGFDLCERLKKDERTSHIPIILLSEQSQEKFFNDVRLKGLKAGADDLVTKPFLINELKVRIQNLIDSRIKMREKITQDLFVKQGEILANDIDKRFMLKSIEVLENNIADSKFNIDSFCRLMNMSRSKLFRKIKALTDHSPNEFIRIFRLQRAAQLLTKTDLYVSEVMFQVGFVNRSYFYKIFTQYYGCPPSQYAKKKLVSK